MSSLGDVIFGSGGKSKQGATTADIDKSLNFIRETTGRAREDIFNLVPQAAENRLLGQEGALDIFRASIPEQLRAFQLGNLGAQQTQAGGLTPQIQAILGQELDLSRLQPRPVPVDLSFVRGASLPEFDTSVEPAVDPVVIEDLINRFNWSITPPRKKICT